MPVSTLVTTPGASNANAYVSRADADQYHLDRPQPDTLWEDADPDQKDAAILWATKLMDRLFIWNGSPATTYQRLLWPRSGLVQLSGWNPVDNTTIPDDLKWATAEFARQLLVSDRMSDSDIDTQGIKLIKASTIRIDFREDIEVKQVPDAVAALIPLSWGYIREISERELLRS